jgi:hypothetical protein
LFWSVRFVAFCELIKRVFRPKATEKFCRGLGACLIRLQPLPLIRRVQNVFAL